MVRRWVVNASSVIGLTKIDRIDLLSELCDEMVIPQGIADEMSLGGYADSAVAWLQQKGQAFIQAAPDVDSIVASWDLGLGESQVLLGLSNILTMKRSLTTWQCVKPRKFFKFPSEVLWLWLYLRSKQDIFHRQRRT